MSLMLSALNIMAKSQGIIEDTHGNVSYRDDFSFTIKPSGMEYAEIRYDDLVDIDMHTGAVDGRRKPSVDAEHHRAIYLRNPGVGAICHTHSPYATAFAIAGRDMQVNCTEHADYFGHAIRCLPFASLDRWGWIDLKGTEGAVLLANHGVLTFSRYRDPVAAVKLAIALEMIAKKYMLAAQLHWALPEPLDAYEVSKWHDRYQNRYGQ
jgi:L-ribulose-5-phosphate 4-epimerase